VQVWSVVAQSNHYLAGRDPPHGVKGAVEEVRGVLARLGPTLKAAVRVGPKVASLDLYALAENTWPWAATTLWVRPIKIGGRKDRVVLESRSEPEGTFSLEVDLDTARKLGAFLKTEILAEMQIHRDRDGLIDGGRLLSFEPSDVPPGGEVEAWERWFKKSVDVDATLEHMKNRGRE
jgi:hypothetical protein